MSILRTPPGCKSFFFCSPFQNPRRALPQLHPADDSSDLSGSLPRNACLPSLTVSSSSSDGFPAASLSSTALLPMATPRPPSIDKLLHDTIGYRQLRPGVRVHACLLSPENPATGDLIPDDRSEGGPLGTPASLPSPAATQLPPDVRSCMAPGMQPSISCHAPYLRHRRPALVLDFLAKGIMPRPEGPLPWSTSAAPHPPLYRATRIHNRQSCYCSRDVITGRPTQISRQSTRHPPLARLPFLTPMPSPLLLSACKVLLDRLQSISLLPGTPTSWLIVTGV